MDALFFLAILSSIAVPIIVATALCEKWWPDPRR